MSRLLAVAVIAAAAVFLQSCSDECIAVAPAPLTGQALGDPCISESDCTSGLLCELVHGGENAPGAITACTQDCSVNACPAGSVCVDGAILLVSDAGGGFKRVCLPTCAADAECQQSTRAGTCLAEKDGTTKVCRPIRCAGDESDTKNRCPTGYSCQGASCGGQLSFGWCRKGAATSNAKY